MIPVVGFMLMLLRARQRGSNRAVLQKQCDIMKYSISVMTGQCSE